MILPVFLTLILGQIESMRLGMTAQLLTTAAREGCRVAVIQNSTQATVQTRINEVLAGSNITVTNVQPTPSNWATAPIGTPITVSLVVPYSQVSWIPTPFFLKTAKIKVAATLSSEKVQ